MELDLEENEEKTEAELKIHEIFKLFDHERNDTIDFRELGTVIRALGGVPTEAEILSIVREKIGTFPNKCNLCRFQAASEDELIDAFTLLDEENKGYLTSDILELKLTKEGEPFTTEELEEMLAAATDLTGGKVHYRDYAIKLASFSNEIL